MLARYAARIGVGAILSLGAAARADDLVTFLPLGPASHVNGISADGHTAVGHFGSGMAMSAVRWRDGVVEFLNPFGGGDCSTADAASGNGDYIFGNAFNGDLDTVPYRWGAGVSTPLPGGITGGCGEAFGAHGSSLDGSIVVGDQGFTRHAFYWTPGGVQDMSLISYFASSAAGVSGDGQTAAGWLQTEPGVSHREAFRWDTATGLQQLGFLPGSTASEATGISLDGRTIIGTSGTSAFRWTELGGMESVPGLRRGLAVSGDGSLIAGSDDDGAAIWSSSGGVQSLRSLLLQDGVGGIGDWTLQEITGVSADGRTLVGNSLDPSGTTQGFVVTLPAPAGAGPLLVLACLTAGRRRRRCR